MLNKISQTHLGEDEKGTADETNATKASDSDGSDAKDPVGESEQS